MVLKHLNLKCFRNYSQFSFFPEEQNLIIGDNGQGKSNLLEALVFLTYGRSFRSYNIQSLIKEGCLEAHVFAEIVDKDKHSVLRFSLEDSGSKQFFINEKKHTSFALYKELPLIIFSAESLALLKGSGTYRRWWLDYWLATQGHKLVVQEFKQSLIQKNNLLKRIQKGFISKSKGAVFLESLNEIFIKKSLNLIKARKQVIQDLSGFLEESGSFIFNHIKKDFKQSLEPIIQIIYCIKGIEKEAENLEDEEKQAELFSQKVLKNSFKEQEAGMSLYGPHRDDFKILFKKKDSRFFCSQGQQRGLLLSLKMAQILWIYHVQKKTCLLLLDDVFSEIDKHLVLNLLYFLNKVPSQKILTSTKIPSFLDQKKFKIFKLK